MECFLDGHVRAFRFLGGVPRRSAYDNLKTAVIWTGRAGDRRLNETFLRLRSHYLFDSRFCNPDSGNEKGRVENGVKLVQHETNFYSVPVRWAHHAIVLKAFADRIELWHGNDCAATHERSWERHRYVLEYAHYLPLLATKPGGLQNARPFRGMLWGEDFELLRRELSFRYGDEGTRKFVKVLLLFTTHPEEQVKAAVRECVRRRAFSDEAVQSVLSYRAPAPCRTLDLSAHPLLRLETDGVRPAAEYDAALLEQEVRA